MNRSQNKQADSAKRLEEEPSKSAGSVNGESGDGQPSGGAPASLPQVSVPKGGGAVRGIGEKFAANPVTGTGAMSVPIATSPGRSGFGPALSLSYDSGAGNGPFGFGWNLSLPSITRKTDKGLPQYNDADESDVFILSGAEDLVPVGESRLVDDVYDVQNYRPRVEGLFARIECWTERATGGIHWRSISKDNVTTLYGKPFADEEEGFAVGRIADPNDSSRIFSWLITESFDDKGNAIIYKYKKENSDGIDQIQAQEQNRTDTSRKANRYLKTIKYGNQLSCLNGDFSATNADWMFEVVFDYGEHDYESATGGNPSPNDDTREVNPGTWSCRQDPFSTYRAGFEVRTYRLCQRVLMFHHVPENQTGTGDDGYDGLVRSTDFAYEEGQVASFLESVTQCGYSPTSITPKKTLPPLEFKYSQASIDETICEVDAASLEGLPVGISGTYQWADLDGEGASGILSEQGGGWFFNRNRSAYDPDRNEGDPVVPRLGPPELVAAQPNASLGGGSRLMDLAGDGKLDLVQLSGHTPGFCEREGRGWESHRPFASHPNINFDDPNLRFVDLNGDGHADILITENSVFTWHPSEAEDGFGPARRISKAVDEEKGPRIVFNDGSQSIHLADMCGDGLTDLVRIRNGEVCYWPNLGYGRFGAKVTMDNAPWFDYADQFDQARIRLADIDGSGNVDIIYLSSKGVCIYKNLSGNRWDVAHRLESFPPIENISSVQVFDLLGTGTACLVWSSPLPGNASSPMRYIDLMSGGKPHLMVSSENGLGAKTLVHYKPSTYFYQKDRKQGTPWVTRLPFPVHVVYRVETHDEISGNRFVTRYAYHHGYFDGADREFRGFGMVEQWDTEEYLSLSSSSALEEGTNFEEWSHVPPVLTKTWFHTGAFIEGAGISGHYESEYFHSDDAGDLLPDTVLADELTTMEMPEACRALKGSVLRREVYGLDGTAKESVPYTVTEQNYTVKRLQEMDDNRHAVFFVHPRETIDYHYERNIEDPRIKHALTLEVDDYGNVLHSAAVGYGRSSGFAEQQVTHVTYSANQFTNAIDNTTTDPDAYRAPLPCESCSYEITGMTMSPDQDRYALSDFTDIADAVAPEGTSGSYVPLTETGTNDFICYHETPATSGLQIRALSHTCTIYRENDLSDSLTLGTAESMGLPYESYTKAFSDDLFVPGQYYEDVTTAMREDAGYVQLTDQTGWWAPSGKVYFWPDPEDSSTTEKTYAEAHFHLPCRFEDPFGNATTVTYDAYNLLPLETTDAVGNTTTAEIYNDAALTNKICGNDYRVLAPAGITDPNGNRTAIAFDELGLVAKIALMGKPGASEGDTLADPTQEFTYDLDCFRDDGSPAWVKTEVRETHYYPDEDATSPALQIAFSYSDGFGREIQKKVQAEPGLAPERDTNGDLVYDEGELCWANANPRWVGSGWTIFNNKGKPVRKYEPFFSSSFTFEPDNEVGVSPIVFYDPVGRPVATLHPDHSWEKVCFTPWEQKTFDAGDTALLGYVGDSDPNTLDYDPARDEDVGFYFSKLPQDDYLPTWYEARIPVDPLNPTPDEVAGQKAEGYADTPNETHFDSLGRAFLTRAHAGFTTDSSPEEIYHDTFVQLDIEGQQLSVTDARQVIAQQQVFSIGGAVIHTSSPDSGDRLSFADADGKPAYVWDDLDRQIRTTYDALRRPIGLFVTDDTEPEIQVVKTVYGESQAAPEVANLRGQVYQVFDGAGVVTNDSYDFKGNVLQTTRQLAVDYKTAPDWSADADPAPTLETETFTTEFAYDALSRVTEKTTPDESVTKPAFNKTGLLKSVSVQVRGAATATAFVENIDYDAKGQRTKIAYGNGAETTYTYDDETFRLTRLLTTRTSDSKVLQDLSYTYDPVGNITTGVDAVAKATFFDNSVIQPDRKYTYDPLYRLVEAIGREHPGQQPLYSEYPRKNIPHPNDPVLRKYTEEYTYDDVGNISWINHKVDEQTVWKRGYTYMTGTNRLASTRARDDDENGPYTALYFYDAHGNMTQMPHLGVMDWDYADRLRKTSVAATGQPTTYYVYDAAGERVRKVTDTASGTRSKERTYLGGWEIYREYDTTDGSTSKERETLHVMDDKQRVALVETLTREDDADVSPPTTELRYQHSDHLGSACVETNGTGQIITYEEYFPFGGTAFRSTDSTSREKRYKYTGKERDEETGLYYHGARYYAPWLGRWTSADPSGMVDGPNLYAYVSNNPVMFHDPNGRAGILSMAREALESAEKSVQQTTENLYNNGNYLLAAYGQLAGMAYTVAKNLIPTEEEVFLSAQFGPAMPAGVAGMRAKSLGSKLTRTKGFKSLEKAAKPYLDDAVAGTKKFADDVSQKIKNTVTKIGIGKTQPWGDVVPDPKLFRDRPAAFEPMSEKQFSRIKNAFEQQGGVIDNSEDMLRYLEMKGAEGLTFDAKTIALKPGASPSTVFEELIHTAQHRSGRFGQWITEFGNKGAIAKAEHEAATRLVKNQKAYGISDAEHLINVDRVKQFQSELKTLGIPHD